MHAADRAFAAEPAASITITHSPTGGMFALGGELKLFVRASCGNELLHYQWYLSDDVTADPANDTPLSGQTSSILSLPNIGPSVGLAARDASYYFYAVVSKVDGSQTKTSAPAEVKIVDKGAIKGSLQNGDFSDVSTFTGINQGPTSDESTTYVCGFDIPAWNTTQGQGSNTTLTMKKRYQLFGRIITSDKNAVLADGVDRFIELSDSYASSVYQEVATTPGSIYSWSIGHAARGSNQTEALAVVIGPALDGAWSGGSDEFPYGETTSYNENTSFFGKVADKLVQDITNGAVSSVTNLSEAQLGQMAGNEYVTTYEGNEYYVYIASDHNPTNKNYYELTSHAGAYTVPEGQGATVFGFAAVRNPYQASGNVLDNVTFAQGSGASITSDVAYDGGGVLSVAASDKTYRYGILEVRGSTVFAAQGVDATINGTPLTPDASGWYAPGATGTLSFESLTPGKTYRVVAIPANAINEDLSANLEPSTVLDESYYEEVTVKAVSDGSGGSGGNIQATTQLAADAKTAKIIVKPARSDVEYALLPTNGAGTAPDAASGPVSGCAWQSTNSGTLSFENLGLGVSYAIVARAKGYDEVTYESQVGANSFVLLTTPSASFRDVTDDSIAVERTAEHPETITVTNNNDGNSGQYFMVYDAETGAGTSDGWVLLQNTKSHAFGGLDPARAYQVVTAEPRKVSDTATKPSTPSLGLRSYGAAPAPEIDYVNETVGKDGVVPATVEYRVQDNADSSTWYFGDADTWVAGTGGTALSLTDMLNAMETSGSSAGATLQYRTKQNVEPSITIESSCALPSRPSAPAATADYKMDYANERVVPVAGAGGGALQARAASSTTWTAVSSGVIPFSSLGWTGAEASIDVRRAGIATATGVTPSFASAVSATKIAARPATPVAGANGVTLVTVSGTSCTLSGVDATHEFSVDGGTAWTAGDASGAQSVTVTSGVAVLVRVKATEAAPASLPLEVSPSSLYVTTSGAFGMGLAYGYATTDAANAAAVLSIKNSSVAGSLKVTKVSLPAGSDFTLTSGSQTGAQKIEFDPAHELAVGGAHGDVSIVPNTGLAAGAHDARVTVEYTDAAGTATFTASTTIVLSVAKAAQAAPTGLAASAQAADSFALSASVPAADAGSGILEFSRTGGSTWSSAVAASGGTGSATFGGLASATAFACTARMAADDNHEASPACAALAVATAHPTPTVADFRIDYHAETLSFGAGLEACSNTADPTGTSYASGASLEDLLEGAGATLQLRHGQTTTAAPAGAGAAGATVDVPASAWLAIPLARPSISAGTSTTDADDSRTPNGSITVSGVASFQYRTGNGASWTTVSGTVMSGLAAGAYSVRTPATGSAFASSPLAVSIAARYCFVTFNLAGGEGTAPAEQRVALGTTTAAVAEPTYAGHAFDGWHASADGGATLDPDAWTFGTAGTAVNADVQLYASWTANAYAVNFNLNAPAGATTGGTMAKQDFTYDVEQALAPNAFTCANWKFTGWNTQADGGGTAYADAQKVSKLATDDGSVVQLYAQWKRPALDVTVPLNATVVVSPDGDVATPSPLDPVQPAAGGYGISSATDGYLKVASVACELDASFAQVFPDGANGVAVSLNSAALALGVPGTPASVSPATGFAVAPGTTASRAYLPLALDMQLQPGTRVLFQGDDAAAFVRITYVLAYDDAAAAAAAGTGA